MCDPVGKSPLVSKSSCDPTYEFEKKLPNGEKVCLLKPIGETSSHIAGGISSANSKLVPAESAFAALLTLSKIPQKKTAQLAGQDPKCGKGEYLDINERGEYICLLNLGPPGEFARDGMTCGEEGGMACDFGGTGLVFPEESHVKPVSPRDIAKIIMGKAEYSCTIKMPYTEDRTVTRDVSVPKIPNESEETTRARLEQAARELTKTITGCHDVKFERLQPIVNGRTEAVIPHSKPTTVIANKCEGEWATQPACRK